MFEEIFETREKKIYKNLFEDKFKEEIELSVKKEKGEFYTEYLKGIEERYKSIILKKGNNGDTDYLEREKIIVETNIKNLERWDFSYSSVTAIISAIVVLVTFGIGKIVDGLSNNLKFSFENALKTTADIKTKQQIQNNFNDLSNYISNLVLNSTVIMIITIAISIIFIDLWSNKKRGDCNRKISFYRMCLNVLDKINKN